MARENLEKFRKLLKVLETEYQPSTEGASMLFLVIAFGVVGIILLAAAGWMFIRFVTEKNPPEPALALCGAASFVFGLTWLTACIRWAGLQGYGLSHGHPTINAPAAAQITMVSVFALFVLFGIVCLVLARHMSSQKRRLPTTA